LTREIQKVLPPEGEIHVGWLKNRHSPAQKAAHYNQRSTLREWYVVCRLYPWICGVGGKIC